MVGTDEGGAWGGGGDAEVVVWLGRADGCELACEGGSCGGGGGCEVPPGEGEERLWTGHGGACVGVLRRVLGLGLRRRDGGWRWMDGGEDGAGRRIFLSGGLSGAKIGW